MSVHYLLDGYNIIHQAPSLAVRVLEDGRKGLLLWINSNRPQGSAANSVTVVFDGSTEHYGGMDGGSALVVFTHGQSADDYIKAAVEAAAQKKKYIVVSDDKGIKLYVRALGAGVLSPREFAPELFKDARAQKTGKNASAGHMGKTISLAQQKKINKELEDFWLK